MSRRRWGRIRKLPSGRYQVRHAGPGGELVAAPETFGTKADAERYLAGVETDQARGRWIDPKLSALRLDEWVARWWSTTTNLRPSTRNRDRGYINRYVLPTFGHRSLGSVTQLEVRSWVADLDAKGLAPATVGKAYALLTKVMAAAVDGGLLAETPCKRVPLPKVEREERRFLTTRKIADLANAIDPRYRAMVIVGAYGGLRISELAGLERDRVNLLRRRVDIAEILVESEGHLFLGPPKTRAGRRNVGIPGPVAEELAEHMDRWAGPELVFPSPGGHPLRATAWRSRFWHPAVVAAGIAEPLRPHDLRHTAVALWLAQGANPEQVAVRAGHSSVSFTLDRYGHLFDDADDALMSGLAEAFVPLRSDPQGRAGGTTRSPPLSPLLGK